MAILLLLVLLLPFLSALLRIIAAAVVALATVRSPQCGLLQLLRLLYIVALKTVAKNGRPLPLQWLPLPIKALPLRRQANGADARFPPAIPKTIIGSTVTAVTQFYWGSDWFL